MFRNLKIGWKLGLGFGLIALILAVAVLLTIIQVNRTNIAIESLIDVHSPTGQANLMLLNGVNHSISALRGWVILGDEELKSERMEAWSTEIEPSIKILRSLSPKWNNEENKIHLQKIEAIIDNFNKIQSDIEKIARTEENLPATKLLMEEGVPLTETLSRSISEMIEIEQTLEASIERKALLGIMADIRGTLGLAIANIRAYVISGEDRFINQFNELWDSNAKKTENLELHKKSLTPKQKELFNIFKTAKDKILSIPKRIFEIRGGDEWNIAHALLSKKLLPALNELKQEINKMLDIQQKQIEKEKEELKHQTALLKIEEWFILVIGLFLCTLAGLLITRSITHPLKEAVEVSNRLSEGDLTVMFDVTSKDETGQLLSAIKRMIENLRNIMKELSDTTIKLSKSSDGLSGISARMASSAEETNIQAATVATSSGQISSAVNGVASGAEESSASMSSIAAMTEEMSTTFEKMVSQTDRTSENVGRMADASRKISDGIHIMAASVEEMTLSLNEVAKNTSHANRVSQNASRRAEEIAQKMGALSLASKQIGKIVGVIKNIADQTNMLALNATIEAAGAGEAGKGFAVVASEVKELAKQSTESTDEIAEQIDQIQNRITEAIDAANEINKIISETAAINESIASSTEEQTATGSEISRSVSENAEAVKTIAQDAGESARLVEEIAKSIRESSKAAKEVARHVDEAARGVKDVARSSSQAASGVDEISKNIQGVSGASKDTAEGASQLDASSKELASMAGVLSKIVNRFKLQ